ncbi:MAG: MBL fold metallo-hydrolase [Myxococcota bacterium]
MCPFAWISGVSHLVAHCLLIETDRGLILVDTGFGEKDVLEPQRLTWLMRTMARPRLDVRQTAVGQVEQLGFHRSDVRHIVLTHLDPDHAGGVPDFPNATLHVYDLELRAARRPTTQLERMRYAISNWGQSPRFTTYDTPGEPWFGFEAVRNLEGVPPEVLLIPLGGHTRGHVAVAVDAGETWLMHCGDAYFHRQQMIDGKRPFGLGLFERAVAVEDRIRELNQERLRNLKRAQRGIELFCAHDAVELERLQAFRHQDAANATAHASRNGSPP